MMLQIITTKAGTETEEKVQGVFLSYIKHISEYHRTKYEVELEGPRRILDAISSSHLKLAMTMGSRVMVRM